jgi:nucleoside-diphosphate-sugar epimerase
MDQGGYLGMSERAPRRSRALVTGAAGFIGSHLVERLLADGLQVTGVDSFEDYYARAAKEANIATALADPGYTFLEANVLGLGDDAAASAAPLRDALREADYVYHLAAQAGVRASWGQSFAVYTENNVRGTQLLLEACRDGGVRRFVYASSSSVYGDSPVLPLREDGLCLPISPYGVTKLAGEHLASLYWKCRGVPTVSLRFFTVYGPRQRPDMAFHIFLKDLIEGRPLVVFGEGDQTRDFTFVSDIVSALVLAAKAPPGGVFNVGGGARVSLRHVLGLLEEVTGCAADIRLDDRQAGDVQDTWADLELARSVLGYQPHVGLHEGLAAEYAWLEGLAAAAREVEARG